jgi:hypothetical protein
MGNPSRFWRKSGSPVALDRARTSHAEDWTKVRKVSSWGNTRRFRRFVVLLWIGLLVFDPWVVFRLARSFAILAKLPELLLPTVSQLLITWLAFRAMQIGLSQPTIEDAAMMEHGEEFESLTNTQREQLFQGRFRDFFFGRIHKDEREAELRLRSEGAAYRLLRPGLVLVVAGYWAVCLLGPFESTRQPLAITAIAVTWIAVAVLVMPTMIRMWTQPNEVGEPRLVRPEKVTRK